MLPLALTLNINQTLACTYHKPQLEIPWEKDSIELRENIGSILGYTHVIDTFKGYQWYVDEYKTKENKYIASKKRYVTRVASYVAPAPGSHRFARGHCTSYVASRTVVPWHGDAKNWINNARAMGYDTSDTPRPGEIVQTNESVYGHVAYVESVDGDTITISEMNYKGLGITSTRQLSKNDSRIQGYINPNK